jgi:hypothetical protein
MLSALLMLPAAAPGEEFNWSLGGYGGQYYDTEPAGIIKGNASFANQYLVALTGSRTLWRSETLPLTLELDGMIGQQFGLAAVTEVAVAPLLRWGGFPWNRWLQTDFRFGPLGVSHTSAVGPLELSANGEGSRTLNFLVIELAFSRPQMKSKEVFVRLHHRCTIYDLLNNYGANGEDFLSLGYRYRF